MQLARLSFCTIAEVVVMAITMLLLCTEVRSTRQAIRWTALSYHT